MITDVFLFLVFAAPFIINVLYIHDVLRDKYNSPCWSWVVLPFTGFLFAIWLSGTGII